MNILFIVAYAPSQIRTRPQNFIKALAKRGNSITLATLWENEDEKRFLDEFAALENVRVLRYPLPRLRILINMAWALIIGEPLQAWYSWTPALIKGLKEEINQEDYDIVHCEHLRGSLYGLAIQEEIKQKNLGIPVIYDSVDSISLLYERAQELTSSSKWRLITKFELPRVKKYEGLLVDQFDHVLATSNYDKQFLVDLASKRKDKPSLEESITAIANGVDMEAFRPSEVHRKTNTIVFSGKMSYHANYSMALHLIEKIMPLIWAKDPGIHLSIVGKSPPAKLLHLADEDLRIEVTGWVPYIRPYINTAAAAVVPLLYGAGIQNKILEAMACATPVVVSSNAAGPLLAKHGKEILVADGPQETADVILHLLSDQGYQLSLGRGGRNYVEYFHNWDKIAEQLENIYQKLIENQLSLQNKK